MERETRRGTHLPNQVFICLPEIENKECINIRKEKGDSTKYLNLQYCIKVYIKHKDIYIVFRGRQKVFTDPEEGLSGCWVTVTLVMV